MDSEIVREPAADGLAGPVLSSAPVSGGNTVTSNMVISLLITSLADRLARLVSSTEQNNNAQFCNLCIQLSRGIDYAIMNSEVPRSVQGLPVLLKKVCQRRNDCILQAAIMVLMLSVKNACEKGWFLYDDSAELSALAIEIGSAFCNAKDINTKASSFLPTIEAIISRFYPQIRLGQILAFLSAKPGYDAYMTDIQIIKNTNSSPEDVRLFVAQTDNTETSSCIISPQQVNFLLNGNGVEGRTNVFMDSGPQVPTNVSHVLKYGTNLLQAVGQFNGNYIIIVAFMSMAATPARPALQDYVQPAVVALDSDSEVMEGSSRISLNCPISLTRIKAPVKGHACKHIQCFDYDNYVEINLRRPNWRCPHCNHSVCFTDIRVDQKMVKILEEVGENVAEVIIAADGSWKSVTESIDRKNKIPNGNLAGVPQRESTTLADDAPEIMDLTGGDDEMDIVGTCDHEDKKPFSAAKTNNISVVNQCSPPPIEDEFWSGFHLPTQNNAGQFSTPGPGNTQLQQFQNSNMINEYGRVLPTSRNVINRTSVAVQAVPVQRPTSTPQQRSRMTSLPPLMPEGYRTAFSNVEMQQQYRPRLNSLQGSYMSSSTLQQQIGNWGPKAYLCTPSQPAQQNTRLPAPPSQLARGYRVPTEGQNLHQPQAVSQRPNAMSHLPPRFSQTQTHHGSGMHNRVTPTPIAADEQDQLRMDVQQAFHMGRMHSPFPSLPPQIPRTSSLPSVSVQPVTRPGGLVDSSVTEQEWRPTGRMRGSLSGRAYSDALNQFIRQPTQPVQPARSSANLTTAPSGNHLPVPPHVLMENNRNAHATRP